MFGIMATVIGMDAGTTNSVVAAIVDGRPEAADNREGNKITPSAVHFSKNGKPTVGERALNMILVAALYVVVEVKRVMGLDVNAYTHPDTGHEYSPADISALILKDLTESAETFYGKEVIGAVVSVPAYFDDKARETTEKATEQAGLNVLGIRNEPTMAILAYLYSHPDLPEGKYAVMDLGGGTLDVTIVEVTQNGTRALTTVGDRRLGGTDFTMAIDRYIRGHFKKQHKIEFDPNKPEDAAYLQDIRAKAEKAKKELSKLEETSIHVMAKGKTISITLSRQEFEQLCQPLIQRISEKWISAVQGGAGDVKNLTGILLVGGATRMPCVSRIIEDSTGGSVPIHKDISADLAVAYGCAIEAARLSGQTEYALPVTRIQDATTFDIGVAAVKPGDRSGKMYVGCIISKGTPLPATRSRRFGMATMRGDSGQQADLVVCEGREHQEVTEEMKVQAFALSDLPPSDNPKKERIEITISADESGIITVEATDLQGGKNIRHQVERKAI